MDYQKEVVLAWLVVNYNENSAFPEYFAECFSCPICQPHSDKKLELRRPGDDCCAVSTAIQSHTPAVGASPLSSPSPAPSWQSSVVSRVSGNWKGLEVNPGPEELGPRVNYRGSDPGLVSPRSHFSALQPLAEQGRRDLSSGLSSHTSPSSCPSHSLRGCLQRTWSWLLGSARGWEAWKLAAVRSQGPAPVLVGAVLPQDAPTAFHGASGSGRGALVSLSGNYTQDGWASTDLGVSRKDRSPVRSHPLVLRTHEDARGRGRERGRRRSLGMLQSSLLRPVLRPSGASTHE